MYATAGAIENKILPVDYIEYEYQHAYYSWENNSKEKYVGTHPTLLQAENFCLLIQPKLRKWISLAI